MCTVLFTEGIIHIRHDWPLSQTLGQFRDRVSVCVCDAVSWAAAGRQGAQ